MPGDQSELSKCDGGIRWSQTRIDIGRRWNMPWIVEHAEGELLHWQKRQMQLFEAAQKDSLR